MTPPVRPFGIPAGFSLLATALVKHDKLYTIGIFLPVNLQTAPATWLVWLYRSHRWASGYTSPGTAAEPSWSADPLCRPRRHRNSPDYANAPVLPRVLPPDQCAPDR